MERGKVKGSSFCDELILINHSNYLLAMIAAHVPRVRPLLVATRVDLLSKVLSYVNLVHAQDCTFSFLEPANNSGPVETPYGHGEITQVELTLIGLPLELSDHDNQILKSSGPQGPQSSLWQNIQWLILRSEVTNRDNQILSRVVLNKAHNQAFGNSALSLGLFQTVANIAVGGHQGIALRGVTPRRVPPTRSIPSSK